MIGADFRFLGKAELAERWLRRECSHRRMKVERVERANMLRRCSHQSGHALHFCRQPFAAVEDSIVPVRATRWRGTTELREPRSVSLPFLDKHRCQERSEGKERSEDQDTQHHFAHERVSTMVTALPEQMRLLSARLKPSKGNQSRTSQT